MPWKSKAQERWMRANEPEMAKKWADEGSTSKGLPEKVKRPMNPKPPRMGHMARIALRKAKASRSPSVMVQGRKD